MSAHPLIEVSELADALAQAPAKVRLIDCSSVLTDPSAGARLYEQSHIPGARYLDLNEDLSDLSKKHREGRHPLPDPQSLLDKLATLGLEFETAIVCYDQDHGAFAARAWWLLLALGFAQVRVLNGGLRAWNAAGMTVQQDVEVFTSITAAKFQSWRLPIASIDQIKLAQASGFRDGALLDARTADRFAGQNETIDPIAGHIPGAINRPFLENLRDLRFKSAAELGAELSSLRLTNPIVVMCGSGVTACHHALAMRIAGLPMPTLFPESWSGWILRPELPRQPA